jgi:prolyl 4-hydroxylase
MMSDFIRLYKMDDISVCDRLIESFEKSQNQHPGVILDRSGNLDVNKDIKDSININYYFGSEDPIFIEFQNQLKKALIQYVAEFVFSNSAAPWTITENVTVQKYLPGGGFKAWHFERLNANLPSAARHLVFLAYLNDVTDEGETEFFYQKVKIIPQKGNIAIWPVDWTHTHRGIPSPSQVKYVVGGWLNYFDPTL